MTITHQRETTSRPPPVTPPTSTAPGHRTGMGATGGAKPKSRTPMWIAAGVVVLGLAGIGVWMKYGRGGSAIDTNILSYTVQSESFDIKIPLTGELKAVKSVEIRCQVEGQTTILSLVPEGTKVKEGDLLATLASDAIKDKLQESKIRLDNALAATVNSGELLRIQEMQNESDIKASETNAELQRLAYEQFDQGDAKVQLDTLKTALENAKTDLERKTKDMSRIKELASRNFVSDNDVLDAQIAQRDSQNKLDTAQSGLDVWLKFTEPRQRATLKRAMDESKAELERVKRKANANLALKQADLRARESTQRVEEARYKNLQEQLDNCTIKAPQPGMVVYENSWGNDSGRVEEGATVRQNQVLFRLPDTSKMMTEVRVAEQITDRVQVGQDAVVTVDTLPGRIFHGKIDNISVMPDSSNRWMNPNLKEYTTQIVLDEVDRVMKPGMTTKTEILIQRLNDVIAVPLQAVFSGGGKSYVYVGSPDKYEKRFVTTGASSSTRMEIKDGLKAGEVVLLSRPKDAHEDSAGGSSSQPGNQNRKARKANGGGEAA